MKFVLVFRRDMHAEEEASLRTGTLVFWLIVFVCLSQLSSLPAGDEKQEHFLNL